MPINTPTGYLDITNATLRGSKIVTTGYVGIANANPTNHLSIGSNLHINDTHSNVLQISGNINAASVVLGGISIAPTFDLEVITNTGNTTPNTLEFNNAAMAFVTTANATIGDTLTASKFVGDGSAISAIQSSNVTNFGSNVSRISALETNLDDNSSRITDLSSNLSDNSSRISTVSTDLGDNSSRISTVSTDLSDNSSRITTLESGDTSISGDKTFTGDIIFESNVHMNGNVLVANTINMTVSDPIIELGSNNLNTNDLGIIMTRHWGNSNVAVVFDEDVDILRMGYTLNGASDSIIDLDSNALAVSVQGALSAASVSGDGSGLTSLNASNITTGALSTTSVTIDDYLIHDGDTDTKVGFPIANTITMTTAGNERLRIESSGNVSIGGVAPESALHIYTTDHPLMFQSMRSPYPKISFDFSGTNAENFQFYDHGTGATSGGSQRGFLYGRKYTTGSNVNSNAGWHFYGNDTTLALRIDGSANVGIGTNNPNAKLHVDSGDIAFEYGHGVKVAQSTGDISQWAAGSGTHQLLNCAWSNNTGAGDVVRFYTPGSQSSTVKLILTSEGNVGINTETMIDHRNYGGLHLANSKGISFAASTNPDSRHWRIRNDDYSDHGSLQFGVSGNNSTPPDAAGESVMTLNRSRNVGIGTEYPLVRLDVHSGLRIHQKGGTINWYNGAVNMSVNGYNGLMFTQNSDNLQSGGTSSYWMVGRIPNNTSLHFSGGGRYSCYMQQNTTDTSVNFTGQHRTFIKDVPFTKAGDLEGLIVSANQNKYIKMSGGIEAGSNAITMNESLPVVSISTKSKDKKCFGVISASEDPETREDEYGSLVTVIEKESGDTRVYINSVGEGAVWVTNINGSLESGDYITTSNVVGYGMLQDDDILHNYTVAKITMDCDFEPVTQPVQRIVKELSNVNYWIETTYSDVEIEEYSNLAEENRRTVTDNETVTYQKIERNESIIDQEGWTLEVRQELTNVLDEHGQLQWEDHPTETEKAYKIRYLDADGKITTEANKVYTAAFVGCTYHCG